MRIDIRFLSYTFLSFNYTSILLFLFLLYYITFIYNYLAHSIYCFVNATYISGNTVIQPLNCQSHTLMDMGQLDFETSAFACYSEKLSVASQMVVSSRLLDTKVLA